MNKTKIKNFSIWARRHLIEIVAYRMRFLGIDENGIAAEMAGSTPTLKLYDMGTSKPAEVADRDIAKRVRLAVHIKDHEANSNYKTAYETVVEEIAYTWFNRLIAIRFMEVNDYLPSGVRVLSSESGKREPDIVTQAVEVAEDQGFAITQDEIWKLKDENKLDELFRIMFIQQCKKLHDVLPELFDNSMDDYTELLLPISFIDDDGFIRHLVSDIDEADFDLNQQGQVEIIGWLYQYYNSEKKDAVFAAMSNKVKVSKENIAAATQLFTPDWIVRYMVENSLGRLWTDGHPETSAKPNWKYYLEEAEQTEEVNAQLAEIRAGRKDMTPEQITFIDPCMGSGHILVYAFDVLMQIYLSCGYTERDAAQKIVRHNLWGLDLDKRAYQLAYFAVMMKARQYDRRFLGRGITPNLSHFQDLPAVNNNLLEEPLQSFVQQFENADTYGSLITVEASEDIDAAIDAFEGTIGFDRNQLEHFMVLYKILSQRYDVVCTNPPYRGVTDCNNTLVQFIYSKYPDSKADLYSSFIEKCLSITDSAGFVSMITMQSWLYLSSFKQLRKKIISSVCIENMLILGSNAFDSGDVGTVVQTVSFVLRNIKTDYNAVFIDLNMPSTPEKKQELFFDEPPTYNTYPYSFTSTANCQFMYDASSKMLTHFKFAKPFSEYAIAKPGMQTSDNDRFLRFWQEIDFRKIGFGFSHADATESEFKWFPYNKGIGYRKWYGNNDYVVNYYHDGEELKYWLTHNPKDPTTTSWSRNMRNYSHYFEEGITFTAIGLAFSARLNGKGYLFDTKGPTMFGSNLTYLCGYVNSIVFDAYNRVLCKQMTKSADSVNMVPVIINNINAVEKIVRDNVEMSKSDWDSFETSWDFKRHPLI